MGNKKQTQKKTTEGKKKDFALKLTRKELVVWLSVGFLSVLWIFALGVIVGRGLMPVRFDMDKLKNELIALKQEALERQKAGEAARSEEFSNKDNFDFYQALTEKKERALARSVAGKEKPTAKGIEIKKSKAKKRNRTADVRKKQGTVVESKPLEVIKDIFTLQIASLKNKDKAEQLVNSLKKQGYAAYKVSTRVPGKGTYQRVRVGHFRAEADALAAAKRLLDDKMEPILIRE